MTTELHRHHWQIEPLDEGVARWRRDGTPPEERTLAGDCKCGATREFSQVVEVIDSGRVFKVHKPRDQRIAATGSARCRAGLHDASEVMTASNGRRFCRRCQSEASMRRWGKAEAQATA